MCWVANEVYKMSALDTVNPSILADEMLYRFSQIGSIFN